MWQRVQTLYLAIACALVGSLFFSRMATIVGADCVCEYIAFSEKKGYLFCIIMLFTANALSLVTFKFRMLQMRVCMLAALMLLGFQIWIGVDFVKMHGQMVYSLTAVFPLVAAILDILASRAVFMDEAMVRQAARLRKAKKKRK